MNQNKFSFFLALGLILLAVVSRLINAQMHLYHFTPVIALGLFSGSVIRDKKYSFLFSIMALLISDLFFQLFTSTPGFYGIEQFFVYGAVILVTFTGQFLKKRSLINVAGFSILSSMLFFTFSNFGVWMAIEFGRVDLYGYGKGFSGLFQTFIAALPFYKSQTATELFSLSLVGDLLFSGLFFGCFSLVNNWYFKVNKLPEYKN